MELTDDVAEMQAVLAAERALYQAMNNRNMEALAAILSSDLVYVHSTAVTEGKELYLSRVAAGHYDYKSIASRDVTVRVREDLAVVSGALDMDVSTGGGPVVMMHLLFVLVWIKQDGEWKLSLRQATSIPSA